MPLKALAATDDRPRCPWATKPLDIRYHDEEWGAPLRDDRLLFEMLTLEGAQAGLSWSTILAKRENYRKAFAGFDPTIVARFSEKKIAKLLEDAGLVRNRLKIESTVTNARAVLAVQAEFGTLETFLWQFTGGKPLINAWKTQADVPARTPQSDVMSRELLKHGFKFVGSTICYAFMQATGMVNDHLVTCFRYRRYDDGNEGSFAVRIQPA